jgi:hypothetical protein
VREIAPDAEWATRFNGKETGAVGLACARQAGREWRGWREAFHLAKKTIKNVKKS